MSFLKSTALNDTYLKLLDIPIEDKQYLCVTDEDNDLIQIHYTDYFLQNKKSNYGDYRGWIINKNSLEVVARSFGYTEEKVCKLEDLPDKEYNIAYEGTLLRIYNEGGLRISTHRKLDCRKSKWSSNKTFYDMFVDACKNLNITPDYFLNSSGHCYVLLLVHPENQIVNQDQVQPTLYHLDTWIRTSTTNKNGLKLMKRDSVDLKLPLPSVLSKDEIQFYYSNNKALITTDSTSKTKFISPTLSSHLTLRGNHPNIKLQWYKLRSSNLHNNYVNILPPAFKSSVSSFDQERLNLQRDCITYFLLPLYYQEILHQSLPYDYSITCSSVAQTVLKSVHTKFLQERNNTYNKKSFTWGKTKKLFHSRLSRELSSSLSSLPGHLLYRCLFDYVKFSRYLTHLNKSLPSPSLLPSPPRK